MDSNGHAPEPLTRIMLRPVASPLPLGLFAFAVGLIVFGCEDLGWLPPSESRTVSVVALCFCVPLQLFGTVISTMARDGDGAVVLGTFATSWAVLGASRLAHPSPSAALGVFLWALVPVSLLAAVPALKSKPFVAVILGIAALRFALSGAFEIFGVTALHIAAGITALTLAALAFYGAEATLVEDTQRRTVLPLFRRGRGRVAMEGDLNEQIARIDHEAGVRQQL